MDFIERWFGIAPDGGTGTLELVFVLVPILVVLMVRWARSRIRDKKALHHDRER